MLKCNQDKINLLNDNKFFKYEFNNLIGRELVKYLTSYNYFSLNNNEPVNMDKNTFSKILTRLQVIEKNINKPFHSINVNDFSSFLSDYVNNKVKSNGNRKCNPQAVIYYVSEFKRLWRVYRQYVINNDKKNFDELFFDWAFNVKPPKVKKVYEQYPYLRIDQVIELSNKLHSEEYKNRVLLAVNLMGRKCEIQNLKFKDIEYRGKDRIFIQLPNIKKNSSDKVPVELYTFVKKEFVKYLSKKKYKKDDYIFPSKEEAFTKNLRQESEKLFNERINPKTLRKIGVAVAEQLEVNRSDVERIGGWAVNSPILSHYFKRKGVEVNEGVNDKIEKALYSDVYVEFDKLKIHNKDMEKSFDEIKKREQLQIQINNQLQEQMKEVLKQMAIKGQIKQSD